MKVANWGYQTFVMLESDRFPYRKFWWMFSLQEVKEVIIRFKLFGEKSWFWLDLQNLYCKLQ